MTELERALSPAGTAPGLVSAAPPSALAPLAPAAPALDDLGPAVCPTCGTFLLEGISPLRGAVALLLSLLASTLALASFAATLAGVVLLSQDGPRLLVQGLVLGGLAFLAGRVGQKAARRPEHRRGTCRVCGQQHRHWISSTSERQRAFTTLFAGPLLLPGLGLMFAAISSSAFLQPRATLAMLGLGAGLFAGAVAILSQGWTSQAGVDRASGTTLGRLLLRGEGVGTSPFARRLADETARATALLSAEERVVLDEVRALAERGSITFESHDDIVWTRLFSYHRLTILPTAVHVVWSPTAPAAFGRVGEGGESELAERLLAELRHEARKLSGGDGQDYRADNEAALQTSDAGKVRLSLVAWLRLAGVADASAWAIEGALRSGTRPRRLTAAAYAALTAPARRLALAAAAKAPPAPRDLRHHRGMNALVLRGRLLAIASAGLVGCAPTPERPASTPSAPSASAIPPVSTTAGEPRGAPPVATASAKAAEAKAIPKASVASPEPTVAARCSAPEKRCFEPKTDTSGGNVLRDPASLPFDANGCLSAERTGGTCAGFRATSGPVFRGGKCCYDGCASPPAPCGRPLFAGGLVRLAALVGGAWGSSTSCVWRQDVFVEVG